MALQTQRSSVLLLLTLLTCVYLGETNQNVYIDNVGGYHGILVAIDPAVPYHPSIIPNIEDYLKQTSEALLDATLSYKLHFNDITIRVPRTWPQLDSCSSVTSENTADANFIVAPDTEQWGSTPHTIRYNNQCGVTDGHTVLPVSFLQDQREAAKYGPNIGKTLVHEWAHQRYGVYDESNDMSCVTVEGHGFPQKCSDEIEGTMTWSGGKCRFVPRVYQPSGYGSLMYLPYLERADSFFEIHRSTHNENITNEHNDRCGGKSVQEVLESHPDLQQGFTNAPRRRTPRVQCVQEDSETKMVLALDVSRSMKIQGRLQQMRDDISEFVSSTPCTDTVVGMVEFSDFGLERTIHRMVSLNEPANVASLISTLPTQTMDRTCIACGIQQSIRTLRNGGYDTEGAIVAVFTEGVENEDQLTLNDIRAEIESSGIILYASVLQNIELNHHLVDIVSKSGGEYCQLHDDKTTTYKDCIGKILNHHSPRQHTTSILVVSEYHDIPSNGRVIEGSFYFDTSLNGLPVFQLEWTDGRKEPCRHLEVELVSPSGNIIPDTSFVRANTFIRIEPSSRQFGKWSYKLWNAGNGLCTARLQVESRLDQQECRVQTQNDAAITLRPHIDATDVSDPTVLYATLNAGPSPIIGAFVVAHVTTTSGEIVEIELWDNGAGADLKANDGIYSRYCILEHDQMMRTLNAKFVARWTDQTRGQKSSSSYGMGAKPMSSYYKKPRSSLKTVERFERTSVGHSFLVGRYPTGISQTPAKITDFRLHQTHYHSRNVTFSWTAVGDNMDHGIASSYMVRISDDIRAVREYDHPGSLVHIIVLYNPSTAGSREIRELSLTDMRDLETEKLYFASIEALSRAPRSSMSNVAMFILSSTGHYEEQKSTDKSDDFPLLIICIALVGFVVLVLSILLCVIMCRKRRSNEKHNTEDGVKQVDDTTFLDFPTNAIESPLAIHRQSVKAVHLDEPSQYTSEVNENGLIDQIAVIKARMRHVEGPPSLGRKDAFLMPQYSDSASDTSSEKTTSSSKPILVDKFKTKPIPRVVLPGRAVSEKRPKRPEVHSRIRTPPAELHFWSNPDEPMQNHPYSNPLFGDSRIIPEIEIRNSAIFR